jgi:hypothetical protein
MNPKLLRQYSDILDEAGAYRPPGSFSSTPTPPAGPAQGTAAAIRAGQGSGAKPSAPVITSNPSAPGYSTGKTGPAKIGNQSFGAPVGGGAKPTVKPAVPSYGAAVKSANAAFAANQQKSAVDQANATQAAQTAVAQPQTTTGDIKPTTPAAEPTPAPQTNALGIAPQANILGSPTGPAAEPTPAPQANAFGIAPQANISGSPTATAEPATQAAKPAAAPAPSNAVKGGFGQDTNMVTRDFEESDDLEEDNELSELMRLSGQPVNEKAVSKQQQKFMGMVHAMQKGEKVKGASPELKKAAKGMTKKAAHDYAATKHKGLPQKVSESVMLEAGSTLEHIIKKFKHETKNFLAGNDLDSDLYDALYDYYSDNGEIPYGVAKARDGDPYQWVSNRFADEMQMHGYGRQADMLNMPGGDHELTELARLAGLSESQVAECGDMVTGGQEDSMNVSTNMSSDGTKNVSISAQGDKADALLQMLKMAGMRPHDDHDEGHEEVVMIGAPDEMMDEDLHTPQMSAKQLASEVVNMLGSGHDAEPFNDLNHFYSWIIEAMSEGDADYYADIMDAMGEDELDHARHMVNNWLGSHSDEMMDEEYANSPDEEYETVSAITRQGNDLNREKRQYADKPKLGDNPMAEDVMLDEELQDLLDSVLFREEMTDVLKAEQPYRDEKTGKMVTPPKGATMPPADTPPPAPKTNAPKVK